MYMLTFNMDRQLSTTKTQNVKEQTANHTHTNNESHMAAQLNELLGVRIQPKSCKLFIESLPLLQGPLMFSAADVAVAAAIVAAAVVAAAAAWMLLLLVLQLMLLLGCPAQLCAGRLVDAATAASAAGAASWHVGFHHMALWVMHLPLAQLLQLLHLLLMRMLLPLLLLLSECTWADAPAADAAAASAKPAAVAPLAASVPMQLPLHMLL